VPVHSFDTQFNWRLCSNMEKPGMKRRDSDKGVSTEAGADHGRWL
jgi:hypothetical protein